MMVDLVLFKTTVPGACEFPDSRAVRGALRVVVGGRRLGSGRRVGGLVAGCCGRLRVGLGPRAGGGLRGLGAGHVMDYRGLACAPGFGSALVSYAALFALGFRGGSAGVCTGGSGEF